MLDIMDIKPDSWDLEFSEEEIRATIDRMARERHNISGDEFIALYRASDDSTIDICGSMDIGGLVCLLPDDPINQPGYKFPDELDPQYRVDEWGYD